MVIKTYSTCSYFFPRFFFSCLFLFRVTTYSGREFNQDTNMVQQATRTTRWGFFFFSLCQHDQQKVWQVKESRASETRRRNAWKRTSNRLSAINLWPHYPIERLQKGSCGLHSFLSIRLLWCDRCVCAESECSSVHSVVFLSVFVMVRGPAGKGKKIGPQTRCAETHSVASCYWSRITERGKSQSGQIHCRRSL